MGDKMDSDDSSSCDMPMEVLNEILVFLPVKSLIRFTCVCKSWLCLIRTNPQFAMRHYLIRTTSCSRLMDNVDSIVEYSKTGRGVSSLTDPESLRLSMYSLTDKKQIRLVKKFELGSGLEVFVSNFCHGIMCMYVCSKSVRGARILFYNPAIGEVVTLPVPRDIGRYEFEFGFGFGFDPLSKDYKIVAVHKFFGKPSLRVDVYSVRDACWHSLGAKAIGPLEKYMRFLGVPVLNANGRILNWLGMPETKSVFGLLSFDMVDEVFREISMPECGYPYHVLPSSGCQACLCFSSFRSFDIWVLNGSFKAPNGDSDDQDHLIWSKHVSLTFPDEDVCVSPTNLWMNDKELLLYVEKPNMGIAEMVLYDLGTQQHNRTRKLFTYNPVGYTESLVSIKGFMSANQDPTSLAKPDGSGANQEQEADGGLVCTLREVTRNSDVPWSYSFRLV